MNINPELIARINELAHKAKISKLSTEELQEQKALRQEYLLMFKANFKQQLKGVKIIDPEGKDVTPQKLKDEQESEGC